MKPEFDVARRKLDEVIGLLDSAAPGPNPQLLQTIKGHCASIGIVSAYIKDHMGRIDSRLVIFFSARKWRDHQGGADGVIREVRGAIAGIGEEIDELERSWEARG
jgi:hypothetical protein